MNRVAIFLTLLVFAAFQPQAPILAGGDDTPEPGRQAIDKGRPFLEGIPNWAKGIGIARDVLDGKEGAQEQFEAGGLTWTPHLASLAGRTNGTLLDAYMRHIDWIRDMQRWEMVLVAGHPADVQDEYEALEDRFVHKEAQLARAMLYAWRWGDAEVFAALRAKRPESKWVLAAIGYIGQEPALKDCVDAMQAILPEVDALIDLNILVLPGLLQPKGSRPDYSTEEGRMHDLDDFPGSECIYDIKLVPNEWSGTMYYERLGALVNEVGDQDYTTSVETEVRDHCVATGVRRPAFDAFAMSAWLGVSPFARVEPKHFSNMAEESLGALLAVYGLHYCQPWMWHELTQCAALAFQGMPDISLCRRFLLSRFLAQGDPMLARLGCRAALALDDDEFTVYNDIARAMLRFGTDKELARDFARALTDSKNDQLVAVAGALASGAAAKLDKVAKAKLKLTLAQKAALLSTFTYDEESTAHGGDVAVYWLNRAAFLEGNRNLRQAATCYLEAVKTQEGAQGLKGQTPTIVQSLLFKERNFTPTIWERELDYQKPAFPKVVERLREMDKLVYDKSAAVESNALAFGLGALYGRKAMDEKVAAELADHPERWGGTGLILAAENALNIGQYTLRRELYQKAVRTSPLCFQVHRRMVNDGESYSTLRAGNWDVAARHSSALTLIAPYTLDALAASANIHNRDGEYGISMMSISTGIINRPACIHSGSRAYEQLMPLALGRRKHWRAIMRYGLADPEVIVNHVDGLKKVIFEMMNGYRLVNWVGMTVFGGPVGLFREQVAEQSIRDYDMTDVNHLLNFGYTCASFMPDQAITWIEMADSIGVSKYGRFVGTQGLLTAYAKKGQWEKVSKRYHEMRGGRAGMPRFLDVFLLAGLTQGNNYAQVDDVMKAVQEHDLEEHADNSYFHFLWRRTHMMAGKHKELAELPVPESAPFQLEDAAEYSVLFHEARALLDAGDFKAISERADPYLGFKVEAGMGVYLDAAILHALARKLDGDTLGFDKKKMMISAIDQTLCDALLGSPDMLDWHALQMLSGNQKVDMLPGGDGEHLWHGCVYGERTPCHMGSGILTVDEASGRAFFIQAALAYLTDDLKGAREMFQGCMDFNQRSSHEYHVAEWLLANTLKEK
jgi:hypothetical protein